MDIEKYRHNELYWLLREQASALTNLAHEVVELKRQVNELEQQSEVSKKPRSASRVSKS